MSLRGVRGAGPATRRAAPGRGAARRRRVRAPPRPARRRRLPPAAADRPGAAPRPARPRPVAPHRPPRPAAGTRPLRLLPHASRAIPGTADPTGAAGAPGRADVGAYPELPAGEARLALPTAVSPAGGGVPAQRSAAADPAVELELARRMADEADRHGQQAELLAQRPALLPDVVAAGAGGSRLRRVRGRRRGARAGPGARVRGRHGGRVHPRRVDLRGVAGGGVLRWVPGGWAGGGPRWSPVPRRDICRSGS